MKIELLSQGQYDITGLQWALRQHEDLWNLHPHRTKDPASPHHELDDIWVRFGRPEEISQPHVSHWYPSAQVLPVMPITSSLIYKYGVKTLGGVLITRIPPFTSCKPHCDDGWHAREYEKFAVQIESAPGQKFCFEDEFLETRPGDLYRFDNQYTHWVENDTPYARITLIVCMKR